ncbi:tyrosine--tRNA ligase [Candidatus Uhrbacteria bacterium]|nr:tyrosine--tRNA ligase [Candidatus Uhrbacteria bacterium]
MKKNTQSEIHELLTRGVERIYPSTEALQAALESGKKLRLYNGIDPTAPTLHIGHGIILKKLRDFQRLGHEVIMLIGDFTAQIGDPTDKLATRKQLTKEEVLENCRKYREQVAKFLDFKSTKNPVQLRFNSEWTNALTPEELTAIASEFTVQQFLERDMFQDRMKAGKPIHIHEFLYPLFQGYDSVAMDVDMEVGGNDQTFNMLIGRDMQKRRGKEKFVFAMKLLVDPTGKKMGKTEGNMITLNDTPEDMYGKVMAWGDRMIVGGFELCTDVPMEEVREVEAALGGGTNPRDLKARLAREIVTLYHGAPAAKKAEAAFISTFQKHETPAEIPNIQLPISNIPLSDLLVKVKFAASKGEAKRVVEQGGVKVDGKVIEDINAVVKISKKGVLVQKGKRYFVRVVS